MGKLRVENTGLELVYGALYREKAGIDKNSYIMYREEFPQIHVLIRYHKDLDEQGQKERVREIERVYHPNLLRRLTRRTMNVFKTVRDSIMDIVNLIIGHGGKKVAGVNSILSKQDKYVQQAKKEIIGSMETSFEPLLEKHIGKKVVLELLKGGELKEYSGILKEYTAEFLEVIDVEYDHPIDKAKRKADLVVPRTNGFIRHLGE